MNRKNDGGAAFPRPLSIDYAEGPCNVAWDQIGMSLRDWFAGQAMGHLIKEVSVDADIDTLAYQAYELADAMLAEREK